MTTQSVAPPPEEPAEVLPKEGDILAGKFRIEKVLGQGGMGVVVAAHHTTLRDKVAVKFLLPEAAKREDATERFLREARAARSIQSEHVARVMDVGTLDTGSPYMVMEFLTGQDLGVMLTEQGAFPIADAIDYVLQACEAIAEAHSIGIIHRDLKPANLFLTRRPGGAPLIKVLDFGLSKVTKPDALDASLTAANVVMGSPCYMSPEQIRSLKGLDARTDIWALGVILYQILTGVRPFEAPSLGALFFTIGADPPVPLRKRRPDIPAELEAAVLKCLEKDPARRTQTIAELARSIAPFGSDAARVSVERIHRLLSDHTPFPIRNPSTSDGDDAIELKTAALEIVDNDPTVAHPGAQQPANYVLRPPGPAYQSVPPPPSTAQAMSAPSYGGPASSPISVGDQQVKSGSMAAIARDGSAPSMRPPPPARNRGGLVAGVVGAAMVLVVVVAVVAVKMGGGPSTAAPASTMGMQAGPGPGPTTEPTPAVTATPVEAAPTAVPTASVEAAPTTTASATAAPVKPPVPKVIKQGGGGTSKKGKDPLDKFK